MSRCSLLLSLCFALAASAQAAPAAPVPTPAAAMASTAGEGRATRRSGMGRVERRLKAAGFFADMAAG